MQTELSHSVSQHIEKAYVIIFSLGESSHDLKLHDCNLNNNLCEFILNRKLNVSFNRLRKKVDSNSSSMSHRLVEMKLPDIVTKR